MSKNSILFLLCFTLAMGVFVAIIFGTIVHKQPDINYITIVMQKPTIPLRGTVYPPKKTQNKHWVILASGLKVRNDDHILQKHFCSLSRDLGKHFNYGDTINVNCVHPLLNGRWVVQDCMAKGSTGSIDFFISRSDLKLFSDGVYDVNIDQTW